LTGGNDSPYSVIGSEKATGLVSLKSEPILSVYHV
jgi:hypothetical protein